MEAAYGSACCSVWYSEKRYEPVLHVSSIHKSNVYVKSAMLTPSGLFNTVLMWRGPAVIMNKSKRPFVNVVS